MNNSMNLNGEEIEFKLATQDYMHIFVTDPTMNLFKPDILLTKNFKDLRRS